MKRKHQSKPLTKLRLPKTSPSTTKKLVLPTSAKKREGVKRLQVQRPTEVSDPDKKEISIISCVANSAGVSQGLEATGKNGNKAKSSASEKRKNTLAALLKNPSDLSWLTELGAMKLAELQQQEEATPLFPTTTQELLHSSAKSKETSAIKASSPTSVQHFHTAEEKQMLSNEGEDEEPVSTAAPLQGKLGSEELKVSIQLGRTPSTSTPDEAAASSEGEIVGTLVVSIPRGEGVCGSKQQQGEDNDPKMESSRDDTATSHDDSAISYDDTAASYDDTATSYDDTAASYDDTTASHDDTAASHGDTAASHDDTAASHDDTVASHGDTAASHDDIATSHDDSTASHDDTTASHDDTAASHDDSAASHAGVTVVRLESSPSGFSESRSHREVVLSASEPTVSQGSDSVGSSEPDIRNQDWVPDCERLQPCLGDGGTECGEFSRLAVSRLGEEDGRLEESPLQTAGASSISTAEGSRNHLSVVDHMDLEHGGASEMDEGGRLCVSTAESNNVYSPSEAEGEPRVEAAKNEVSTLPHSPTELHAPVANTDPESINFNGGLQQENSNIEAERAPQSENNLQNAYPLTPKSVGGEGNQRAFSSSHSLCHFSSPPVPLVTTKFSGEWSLRSYYGGKEPKAPSLVSPQVNGSCPVGDPLGTVTVSSCCVQEPWNDILEEVMLVPMPEAPSSVLQSDIHDSTSSQSWINNIASSSATTLDAPQWPAAHALEVNGVDLPIDALTVVATSTPTSQHPLPIDTNGIPLALDPLPISTSTTPLAMDPSPISADDTPVTPDPFPIPANTTPVGPDHSPIPASDTPLASVPPPISAGNTPLASVPSPISAGDTPLASVPSPIPAGDTPDPSPISAGNTHVSPEPSPIPASGTPVTQDPSPIPASGTPVTPEPSPIPASGTRVSPDPSPIPASGTPDPSPISAGNTPVAPDPSPIPAGNIPVAPADRTPSVACCQSVQDAGASSDSSAGVSSSSPLKMPFCAGTFSPKRSPSKDIAMRDFHIPIKPLREFSLRKRRLSEMSETEDQPWDPRVVSPKRQRFSNEGNARVVSREAEDSRDWSKVVCEGEQIAMGVESKTATGEVMNPEQGSPEEQLNKESAKLVAVLPMDLNIVDLVSMFQDPVPNFETGSETSSNVPPDHGIGNLAAQIVDAAGTQGYVEGASSILVLSHQSPELEAILQAAVAPRVEKPSNLSQVNLSTETDDGVASDKNPPLELASPSELDTPQLPQDSNSPPCALKGNISREREFDHDSNEATSEGRHVTDLSASGEAVDVTVKDAVEESMDITCHSSESHGHPGDGRGEVSVGARPSSECLDGSQVQEVCSNEDIQSQVQEQQHLHSLPPLRVQLVEEASELFPQPVTPPTSSGDSSPPQTLKLDTCAQPPTTADRNLKSIPESDATSVDCHDVQSSKVREKGNVLAAEDNSVNGVEAGVERDLTCLEVLASSSTSSLADYEIVSQTDSQTSVFQPAVGEEVRGCEEDATGSARSDTELVADVLLQLSGQYMSGSVKVGNCGDSEEPNTSDNSVPATVALTTGVATQTQSSASNDVKEQSRPAIKEKEVEMQSGENCVEDESSAELKDSQLYSSDTAAAVPCVAHIDSTRNKESLKCEELMELEDSKGVTSEESEKQVEEKDIVVKNESQSRTSRRITRSWKSFSPELKQQKSSSPEGMEENGQLVEKSSSASPPSERCIRRTRSSFASSDLDTDPLRSSSGSTFSLASSSDSLAHSASTTSSSPTTSTSTSSSTPTKCPPISRGKHKPSSIISLHPKRLIVSVPLSEVSIVHYTVLECYPTPVFGVGDIVWARASQLPGKIHIILFNCRHPHSIIKLSFTYICGVEFPALVSVVSYCLYGFHPLE